jgi:hypothetical protein
MNKKIIPLAALVAMAGAANVAQAVNVNHDGLGEVLIYPFYSVVEGNDTYINVVNTTDEVKAVKVRFVEGMNSKEVLDFNLYLSPWDHWSAVVTAHAGGGAMIKTADTSCTVPEIPAAGVPFSKVLYSADSVNDIGRTREGYVEIIEMGVVSDTDLAAAATHVAGIPTDCPALTTAWSGGGQWSTNPADGMSTNEGGLYGYGVLINVNGGTNATYDAVAMDAFNNVDSLHARPGNSSPSLDDATPTATVIDNATVVTTATTTGLDAVSAVIMHDTIANDYVLEPDISAGTDWVVTFPTKNAYVNGAVTAPFTTIWSPAHSSSCEEISVIYYDREEEGKAPSGVQFSPRTPEGSFALCQEANVLTFNGADVLGAGVIGNVDASLDGVFDNGWATIDFTTVPGRTLTGTSATFHGLPVIGFAVQEYVNGTLVVDGSTVLSNYQGSVLHKATRDIDIDTGTGS